MNLLNKEKNKKAGLYIRVSTELQVDKDSLTTQAERLKTYCKQTGYQIVRIYKDAGLSAKNTNRPALTELMHDIESGQIDVVLVTKLDRITRSIRDLCQLMDFFASHQVHFTSLSESIDTKTAMGRFFYQLLGLLAQLEREVTAERVATDMRHRAEKGKWTGGVVPFGYTTQSLAIKKAKQKDTNQKDTFEQVVNNYPDAKKLYIDPDEAETIRWIFEKYIENNSVRKVAILLNSKGIKTRQGELWPQTTIHRILKSPIYIGKTYYGKRKTDPVSNKLVKQEESSWTIVEAEHEPIISEDVFNKIQELLSSNAQKPTKTGRTYLLSGLLKCGLCGGGMNGYTFTKKGEEKSYSYYKCWNKLQKGDVACKGLSIPAIALENFIVDQLKQLSENHEFLSDKQKIIIELKENFKKQDTTKEVQQLEETIVSLKAKLNNLLDKLEDGLIEDEDFKPRYKKIKSDIKVLEDEKCKIIGLIDNEQIVINNLNASFEEISSFGSNWEFLDDIGKSMRIKSIVKNVRVTKEKVELFLYLDVVNLSRTDRDSSQRQA
ncbi:MAG: recombinase family protein [Desulfamplus sp.]|nr:recombinase family protein [Desulfamplus sp.]